MKPSYNIDLSTYDLRQLRSDLTSRDLIPSRTSLLDDLDLNFQKLEDAGISNLAELLSALKDKTKLRDFSQSADIPEMYLTLLRREANSYLAKPVGLGKFEGFSHDVLEKLAALGVKHSRHLFEQGYSSEKLKSLAAQTGLPLITLQHLRALSDLVRAYGVGPVFAELLYQSGIHSMQEFQSRTPEEIVELYQTRTGKKADFSLSDLKFSLELARRLDHEY